ncbi:hypothetical protein JCGZ_14397 [Jatropha curcas]|uniref:Uncharacterized protein n=1 Tax=Jatropha curcas TaxID=180498 RepID=A0A067JXD4_JATCU|nr:hypothetical protein JCGZ_14397 [Jatropha curcas]
MDTDKGESGNGKQRIVVSQEEGKDIKKCLEENNGDDNKCKSKIDSFHSSYSNSRPRKRLPPLRLGRGSLTDV